FPRAFILVWRAETEANDPARVLSHLDRHLHDLPEGAPHLNASLGCDGLRARLNEVGAFRAAALVGDGPRYTPFTPAKAQALAALYHADLAKIAGMGGRVRLLANAGGRKHKD